MVAVLGGGGEVRVNKDDSKKGAGLVQYNFSTVKAFGITTTISTVCIRSICDNNYIRIVLQGRYINEQVNMHCTTVDKENEKHNLPKTKLRSILTS